MQAFELAQNAVLPIGHLLRELHVVTDKGVIISMLAAVVLTLGPINQSGDHRETGGNQHCQQFNVADIVTPTPVPPPGRLEYRQHRPCR